MERAALRADLGSQLNEKQDNTKNVGDDVQDKRRTTSRTKRFCYLKTIRLFRHYVITSLIQSAK